MFKFILVLIITILLIVFFYNYFIEALNIFSFSFGILETPIGMILSVVSMLFSTLFDFFYIRLLGYILASFVLVILVLRLIGFERPAEQIGRSLGGRAKRRVKQYRKEYADYQAYRINLQKALQKARRNSQKSSQEVFSNSEVNIDE